MVSDQYNPDDQQLITDNRILTADETMTEDAQGRVQQRRWIWPALAVLAAILAVAIVPPLVNLSRYKSRITQLISASLGRPARLSSVEMRLLPRPGFVLTDLTVEEDPVYGAEPILHANSVVASIRLLSLWRGRLEIGRISVDEASLNLVRTPAGQWNLDSLFSTAAAQAQPVAGGAEASHAPSLPYMVATNSRINIKNGTEKLPFSLINADLSFWQEEPGDWRVRLRGQPARTDLSLDMADTGVVRLEASARRAQDLRKMPMHIDLEWREAQLGQLTRLVIGSDPGWRGDLTGEVHMDGTADAAQLTTRLRATGVHRAEFAPASPLDFDARCSLVYHYSGRAIENLACDSPLGEGRIRFAGELPGEGKPPQFSIEMDRIPVAAGLDALRTVRNGFGPGLEARGTISGKVTYAESASERSDLSKPGGLVNPAKVGVTKPRGPAPGPLSGSFTVEGFLLSGDGLSQPIQIPKLALEPVAVGAVTQGRNSNRSLPSTHPPALAATVAIPAGGAGPLTMNALLSLTGYVMNLRGQVGLARARELAHVAGLVEVASLDGLAGDPATVEMSAEGPWLPAQAIPFSGTQPAGSETQSAAAFAVPERLSGTLTLHNANWQASYLANHVEIAQATLHFDNGKMRWDPVVFSYGPVKGTANLEFLSRCDAPQPCIPRFQVQFGALDASTVQSAFLGAREPGTLLSTLIARLRSSNRSTAQAWPQLEGTVKADSILLGPVTLREASATLRILQDGAEIQSLDAGLLGGRVHGSGTMRTAETDQGKPTYTLEGRFEKLSPSAVGQLLGLRWSGGALDADGKIDLSGLTDKDLAASAKGALHFNWRYGAMNGSAASPTIPLTLHRFDRWTGDAEIANGALALKENQATQGGRRRAVEATVTFGNPPKVVFIVRKETPANR